MATIIYARTGNRAPALFLNLVKGTIAVAMLGVTILVLGDAAPELTTSQWLWLAGSGVVGISIGDSAYFSAIKRVGPSQTLLIESLAPPLTGVLALFFLHEAIGFWAWTGIFLTMSGILWVVTEHHPQQKSINLPGLGFATLAALCQATGMVMSRQVMVTTDITPSGLPSSAWLRPAWCCGPCCHCSNLKSSCAVNAGGPSARRGTGGHSSPWLSFWARFLASGCNRPPSS